jgi:NAD(P)-dependent dehydrogenase (short-subunit alcohol dehydrogenase family)
MHGLMQGKVALVTGAGSGIGRTAALAFAREGAKVAVADIAQEGGLATVALIEKAGGNAVFIRCDVARQADVEAMVNRVVGTYGRLDYAFNNAGIGPVLSTLACTEDEWDAVHNINLKGLWFCLKHEIPEILKQGGAIVNTASVAGLIGAPGHAPYTAAKHGVVGLTKVVALEYAKEGIRVNAVCPGVIRTPMLEAALSANPEVVKMWEVLHPMGRIGEPEEVAEAVIWLCSDKASFITGQALAIDGGLTAT